MPRVDVPEYKTFIDFPDGTPPAEMQQVLSTSFPPRDSLATRALKGVTNFAVSTAHNLTPLAFAAAPLLPESTKKALSDFYDETGGFVAQNQPTKPQGVADRVVDAVSGLAPAIATGPVGATAILNNSITGTAAESQDQGDSALQTVGKAAVSGASTAGMLALPVGKLLPTLAGAGGAVAISNADRLAQNALSDEQHQRQFDITTNVLEPLVTQLGFGTYAHLQQARGASKVINDVASRMENGKYVPQTEIDGARAASRIFIRREKRQAAQDRIQAADTEMDARMGTEPVLPTSQPIADSEFSPDFGRRGPAVADAETAQPAQNPPTTRTGPSLDNISIEAARLKSEHPHWSDAEVWTEAQRSTLTHNPEVVPPATDMSTVRPADLQPVRPAEDAPRTDRGTPIGNQEMGQRFGTSDRLTDPTPPTTMLLNPEVLPARTDADRYAAPSLPEVRPAENAPSRTVPEPFFNHDSLPTAAVKPVDSLVLQDAAPHLKIAVVGTPAEIKALGKQPGKTIWRNGEKAYVIDTPAAIAKYGSLTETKRALRAGDPEALGYPDRPAGEPLQTAAVTKTGEVLVDPNAIKQAATAGDVAYAAEGTPADLQAKVEPIAEALAPTGPKGGGENGQKEGRGQEVLNNPVDLHAGVHLPTLVKQAKDLWTHYTAKLDPTSAPGSVKEFLDKNREANRTFGVKPVVDMLHRAIVDSSANVQNALVKLGPQGEFVRRQFDSISGASAKAGLAVEAQRSSLSGMSLREQQAMGDLIAIDRDLSIADYKTDYTLIGGKSQPELAAARQTFQQDYKLSDAEMARVNNSTRKYFDAWKQNTQRMLDAGLIDATQKIALDSHEYSPKQFLDKIDPDIPGMSGKVTVPDSGIAKLKQGSDSYFRSNPMRLLSEATARIETRIARNEANQALASLPAGNGIAEVVKPGAVPPPGYEAISYMKDGKQQTIHMRSDLAAEWVKAEPMMNHQLVTALQWVTGAKIVRAAATGYNPAFILTNVPRDLVTIWMQAEKQGYSKHAPVAVAEMASDLKTVARDAWARKGRYLDYVAEGGGRELLTHEGALSSRRENLGPALAKVQKTLSYVNEFSEILTRLAYRERMIKNGMDPATASKASAEYVDFSRGGTVVKAIDRMGIPYLNAAVQGTRAIGRPLLRDPAMFAYKAAQMMVGVSGLYAINQITNSDGWANVSDRDKANNFIIMLPKHFEYVDKNGTTVSPYLKISKEQGMRPFTTIAEMATALANGEKPSGQQMQMAMDGASPISLDKMPPAMAALWTYILNADTYTKEPVWRGKQEIEPYAEYTANTNPILTAIGKATSSDGKGGLSPDRMSASLSKIIPSTNMYAQMAGNALTDIYEKINPPERAELQRANYEKLKSIPGVSRILSGAADTNQYREGIKEARVSANTESFEVNKTLDAMVIRYVKTGSNDAALYDRIAAHVAKQPEAVQSRMEKRIEMLAETATLPDRGWWMSTRALQPEDRADQFKIRYDKAAPDEQKRMLEIADGLKGYVSDRFIDKWESR